MKQEEHEVWTQIDLEKTMSIIAVLSPTKMKRKPLPEQHEQFLELVNSAVHPKFIEILTDFLKESK